MKFRRVMLILVSCVYFATLAGCSKKDDTLSGNDADDADIIEETTPILTDEATEKKPENQPKSDGTSDIHVTIESVEVSLEELKAQEYTVPVMITIDENSGITYSEWGAVVDSRCQFTADNHRMDYSVYYSINEEHNFMWTAWSSGSQVMDSIGNLLKLEVTLPEDAAVGDSYEIKYQSVSLAEKPHVWSGDSGDWAEVGYVTWTDGGITVVE